MKGLILLTIMQIALAPSLVWAELLVCHPLLWPPTSAVMNPVTPVSKDTLVDLQQWSKKIMQKPAQPIPILGSAGKTDLNDPILIASRRAFQDADNMAVLALTYRLSNDKAYFNKIREVLLLWAHVNHPTGHPIDETRLAGMLWAYDLIACDLSAADKNRILKWFERMRLKKIAWKFDNQSSTNNHRIHQIKMLLLLDKLLQRQEDWLRDLKSAETYSHINLEPQSGLSVDYIQRSALFYHNYTLQPWLEISLITDCCHQSTNQAFQFLANKILSHDIKHEFIHSQVKIDKLRAKHGFTYAKRGGKFDETNAAATIVTYYTINRDSPNPRLWRIVRRSKPSPWMAFIKARRVVWQP